MPDPQPAAATPPPATRTNPWANGGGAALIAHRTEQNKIDQAFRAKYGHSRDDHVAQAERSVLPQPNSDARSNWLSSSPAAEPRGRAADHPINTYHRLERQAKDQARSGQYAAAHELLTKAIAVEEEYVQSCHGGARDGRHQTAHNVRRARANSLLGSEQARSISESEAVAKAKLEVAQFEQQYRAAQG